MKHLLGGWCAYKAFVLRLSMLQDLFLRHELSVKYFPISFSCGLPLPTYKGQLGRCLQHCGIPS